jgi:hypothetical protein
MMMWSGGENVLSISYILFLPVIAGLFLADRRTDRKTGRRT